MPNQLLPGKERAQVMKQNRDEFRKRMENAKSKYDKEVESIMQWWQHIQSRKPA